MDSTLNIKYISNFLTQENSLCYMNELVNYDFQNYPLIIYGKLFTPSRKMIAFSDEGSYNYSFSGTNVPSYPWTPLLLEIRKCVEMECGSTFNYALLNFYASGKDKIAAHKDDESSLDPDSPIAIVSLGATRTMQFTRKNFKTEKLPLESGSLLVMTPDSNKLWYHAIPPEPKVIEPRVSITFRKMTSSQKESERNGPKRSGTNPRSPPAKRACSNSSDTNYSDNNFPDDGLDMLLSNTSSNPSDELKENVFKKDIGGDIIVSIEMFRDQLKIHIRQYAKNVKGLLYPTKDGITMDLFTWYDFYLKLTHFNTYYTSASYVANNLILVLNINSCTRIQALNLNNNSRLYTIELNIDQINALKESANDVNQKIINYSIAKCLPYYIKRERRLMYALPSEEEDLLLVKLIICIEKELSAIFQNIFECNGCIINHPSQTQHPCLTMSSREKYESLGDDVLLLLNMKAVALSLVNTVDFISEHFLNSLCINTIKDLLFRTEQ